MKSVRANMNKPKKKKNSNTLNNNNDTNICMHSHTESVFHSYTQLLFFLLLTQAKLCVLCMHTNRWQKVFTSYTEYRNRTNKRNIRRLWVMLFNCMPLDANDKRTAFIHTNTHTFTCCLMHAHQCITHTQTDALTHLQTHDTLWETLWLSQWKTSNETFRSGLCMRYRFQHVCTSNVWIGFMGISLVSNLPPSTQQM